MRKRFGSRLWRRTKRLWGNDVENREKKFRMPIRKKMFWAIYSLILLLTFIIDSSRLWRRTKRLWGNDVENREKKFRMPIRKKMFWAIYSLILLLTFIIDSLVFVTYRHDMESKITLFGNQTVQELAVNISRNIRNKEENFWLLIYQEIYGIKKKIWLINYGKASC